MVAVVPTVTTTSVATVVTTSGFFLHVLESSLCPVVRVGTRRDGESCPSTRGRRTFGRTRISGRRGLGRRFGSRVPEKEGPKDRSGRTTVQIIQWCEVYVDTWDVVDV